MVALSLGTDQALHVLKVYSGWGQPMHHYKRLAMGSSRRRKRPSAADAGRSTDNAPRADSWV